MLERAHRYGLAAMLGVLGLVVAGTAGAERQVLLALVATRAADVLPRRRGAAARAHHGVDGGHDAHRRLDRPGRRPRRAAARLDHGGALVFLVLLGTFLGDTGAYFGGRAARPPQARAADLAEQDRRGPALRDRRRHARRLVPRLSYSDESWIAGLDGLLLGLTVTIAAPIGDLFESLVKRDMGTKDTGTLFGAHGGALDRVDAALFALVAGYYVWLALA